MQSPPAEFHGLPFREMFLVWAIRVGCSPCVERMEANGALEHAFRLAKVSDALHDFLGFAHTVVAAWHHARRAPDIHCVCSAEIGEDEWRLVRLMAALQDRDLIRASNCVSDVLPRASVRLLLDRALHVASAFGAAGWHFAPRSVVLERGAALH
jgi:hypothetical protein